MSRSIPRSTSIVTSACVKLRFKSRMTRTGSLIAKDLHRIRARGLVRGIKRRQEGADQRNDDDCPDLKRVRLRGQIREEAELRHPQVLAGDDLDHGRAMLSEEQEH